MLAAIGDEVTTYEEVFAFYLRHYGASPAARGLARKKAAEAQQQEEAAANAPR